MSLSKEQIESSLSSIYSSTASPQDINSANAVLMRVEALEAPQALPIALQLLQSQAQASQSFAVHLLSVHSSSLTSCEDRLHIQQQLLHCLRSQWNDHHQTSSQSLFLHKLSSAYSSSLLASSERSSVDDSVASLVRKFVAEAREDSPSMPAGVALLVLSNVPEQVTKLPDLSYDERQRALRALRHEWEGVSELLSALLLHRPERVMDALKCLQAWQHFSLASSSEALVCALLPLCVIPGVEIAVSCLISALESSNNDPTSLLAIAAQAASFSTLFTNASNYSYAHTLACLSGAFPVDTPAFMSSQWLQFAFQVAASSNLQLSSLSFDLFLRLQDLPVASRPASMRQPLYAKLLLLLLQQCRLSSPEPSGTQLAYRKECSDLIISCYQLLGVDVLTTLLTSAHSSPNWADQEVSLFVLKTLSGEIRSEAASDARIVPLLAQAFPCVIALQQPQLLEAVAAYISSFAFVVQQQPHSLLPPVLNAIIFHICHARTQFASSFASLCRNGSALQAFGESLTSAAKQVIPHLLSSPTILRPLLAALAPIVEPSKLISFILSELWDQCPISGESLLALVELVENAEHLPADIFSTFVALLSQLDATIPVEASCTLLRAIVNCRSCPSQLGPTLLGLIEPLLPSPPALHCLAAAADMYAKDPSMQSRLVQCLQSYLSEAADSSAAASVLETGASLIRSMGVGFAPAATVVHTAVQLMDETHCAHDKELFNAALAVWDAVAQTRPIDPTVISSLSCELSSRLLSAAAFWCPSRSQQALSHSLLLLLELDANAVCNASLKFPQSQLLVQAMQAVQQRPQGQRRRFAALMKDWASVCRGENTEEVLLAYQMS